MLTTAWLGAALLCGCAGKNNGAVPAAAAQANAASGPTEGTQESFTPSSPPARLYNAIAETAPRRTALFDAILRIVVLTARSTNKSAPISDPRLYSVAEDLASIVPRKTTLPYAPVEFMLSHYGVIEPTPAMLVVFASPAQAVEVANHLKARLERLIIGGEYARIGIGSAPRDLEQEATVVMLLKSHIDATPMPRALGGNQGFEINAHILPPFVEPAVIVTRENGSVDQLPIAKLDETRFISKFSCDGRTGRHQVEVTATSRRGPAVLANFPVWCDAEPPTIVTWRQRTNNGSHDIATAELRMTNLVNQDRAAAGLARLNSDAAVADVARHHSEEMARLGLVAHTLESSGTAADRLRTAGIHTASVAENLARAGDVEDAHAGLMNSPGHRVNIMLPDATHIGVGIAIGPESGTTSPELFITQIYIRKPPTMDPTAAKATISDVVRKKIYVRPDAALDRLAQSQADGIARGMPAEVATTRTVDSIKKEGLRFQRVRALFAAVTAIDAFTAQQAEADLRMTHFGVGVAQGDHESLGKNTIFIIVLLGQKSPGSS